MRRYLSIALLLVWLGLGLQPAYAQDGVQVVQATARYEFGQQVTIQATIHSPTPLSRVEVFLQPQGSPHTVVGEALLGDNGQVFYLLDLQRQPLRAFATVLYWFRVTTEDGQVVTTPAFSFDYYDQRFDWQTLESPPFVVHWYQGSTADAQQVLDAARQGLSAFQQVLPVEAPPRLDIFVYAKYYDLQSSLEGINRHLVAGHADPDLGLVVAALPPGPSFALDTRQRIPHELAHVLLYRFAGPQGMAHIPPWLDEGLASLMEAFPSPDYAVALQKAAQDAQLIPLRDLCTAFPTDASGALLAYAEAQSFVDYLYRRYGSQGLQQLVQAYMAGLGCENAPQQALGTSLAGLEHAWQAELFGSGAGVPWETLLPWLVLLLLSLTPVAAALWWGRRRPRQVPSAS